MLAVNALGVSWNTTDGLKVGLHDKYRKEHPTSSFYSNCLLGAINTFNIHSLDTPPWLTQATRRSPLVEWMVGHNTILFDLLHVLIDDGVRVGVGPQRGFKFSVSWEVSRAFSSKRSSCTQTFALSFFPSPSPSSSPSPPS